MPQNAVTFGTQGLSFEINQAYSMNNFNDTFIAILQAYQSEYSPIVTFDINSLNLLVLDLSSNNPELQKIDFRNSTKFTRYVYGLMSEANTPLGIGKYNEDRIIYRQSENFQGHESRSIHLGVDLWASEGTEIFSPLPAVVHSFKNNLGYGNYGPTLILRHHLENVTFYTLYGHLSEKSLKRINKGQVIQKGEAIATLGNTTENGGWPPHLHFQIIRYMLDWKGDFPGVASVNSRDFFLKLCPDPNLVLRISGI